MDLMTEAGFRGQWLLYCIIMGDIHECVDRISYWKHHKFKNRIRVTAQPFRDPFGAASITPPNGNGTWQDGQTEKSFTPQQSSEISAAHMVSSERIICEPPQWQKDLAHWANQRQAWWSTEFKDFSPRKGFFCKEYL